MPGRSVAYFRLSIFNCRNSIRKPDKEDVFHIAACNLSVWNAKPNNIDFRKARPKEQRRNAPSEETDKRFSKYCPGYRYCFIHEYVILFCALFVIV
jgi:hypothetical protein